MIYFLQILITIIVILVVV